MRSCQSVPLNERFAVTRREGELVARKLITYHPDADGKESRFEIWQESDGSQRVIDLLPAFLELSAKSSKRVYIIDELDRSLHTQLTWKLLDEYFSRCSGETRTQLLFTTHDLLLMDQDLLRRDERWIADICAPRALKMHRSAAQNSCHWSGLGNRFWGWRCQADARACQRLVNGMAKRFEPKPTVSVPL